MCQNKAFATESQQIKDTQDWYTEVCALYPESREDMQRRYDLVTDHYKRYPIDQGKNLCLIVATHQPFLYNLPERFNVEDDIGLVLNYCKYFKTSIKIRPDGTRDDPLGVDKDE